MRDFSNFNLYLNAILGDDYGQEPDSGHTAMIREVIHKWVTKMTTCKTVLDVGAGAVAIAEPFFKELGIEYTGIALGLDSHKAQKIGKNVLNMDMNFMEFQDYSFDFIFARHVVEHSPMPMLTLMEFHRVAKSWMCLIVPDPKHYGRVGLQHYSVLEADQWEFLAERAGWGTIWKDMSNPTEFRFMFEKRKHEYQRNSPIRNALNTSETSS